MSLNKKMWQFVYVFEQENVAICHYCLCKNQPFFHRWAICRLFLLRQHHMWKVTCQTEWLLVCVAQLVLLLLLLLLLICDVRRCRAPVLPCSRPRQRCCLL